MSTNVKPRKAREVRVIPDGYALLVTNKRWYAAYAPIPSTSLCNLVLQKSFKTRNEAVIAIELSIEITAQFEGQNIA